MRVISAYKQIVASKTSKANCTGLVSIAIYDDHESLEAHRQSCAAEIKMFVQSHTKNSGQGGSLCNVYSTKEFVAPSAAILKISLFPPVPCLHLVLPNPRAAAYPVPKEDLKDKEEACGDRGNGEKTDVHELTGFAVQTLAIAVLEDRLICTLKPGLCSEAACTINR